MINHINKSYGYFGEENNIIYNTVTHIHSEEYLINIKEGIELINNI
jgi:hypothetical protein